MPVVLPATFFAIAVLLGQTLAPLTDAQVDDAIALGKTGKVPVVFAGRFLGISKGDLDVWIEGPVSRIAAAADAATKQLRPFTRADVTGEMREPLYQVRYRRTQGGGFVSVQHIVLMPRKSKNLDEAIQPVHESLNLDSSASFDRIPTGEFDVVIVTSKGQQRYNVDAKVRAQIR